MRDRVLEKLRRILTQDFRVPAEAVVESADVRADLWLDSVLLVDLFYVIQKDFDFDVDADEFREVKTIGELVDFIASRMAGPSSLR